MKLSTYLSIVLFAIAILMLGKGVASLGFAGAEAQSTLNSETWLLAAGFSAMIPVLIFSTRGYLRTVMVLISIGLITDYVLRIGVVLFFNNTYSFKERFGALTSAQLDPALLFIAISVFLFWVGLQLGGIGRKKTATLPSVPPPVGVAFRARHGIVLVTYGVLLLNFYLSVVFREGISGVAAGPIGFLMRLSPEAGMQTLCMFIFVRYNSRLTRREKAAILSVFVLSALAGFVRGSRSSFVALPLSWLFISVIERGDPRIALRHAVLLGAVVLVGFFYAWNFGTAVRDVQTSTGGTRSLDAVQTRFGEYTGRGVGYTFSVVSNRLNEFDRTVAVVNYRPPGLENQLSASKLLGSMVNQLTLDRFFRLDLISHVKLFAFYYEGVPFEIQHGTSWSGFGMAFALYQWRAILVYFGFGFIVAFALRHWPKSWSDTSRFVRVQFLSMVFSIFVLGAVDTSLAVFVSETILTVFLLAVVSAPVLAARQGARTPQMPTRPGAALPSKTQPLPSGNE